MGRPVRQENQIDGFVEKMTARSRTLPEVRAKCLAHWVPALRAYNL